MEDEPGILKMSNVPTFTRSRIGDRFFGLIISVFWVGLVCLTIAALKGTMLQKLLPFELIGLAAGFIGHLTILKKFRIIVNSIIICLLFLIIFACAYSWWLFSHFNFGWH
jgi:hypothetical protein